MNVVTDQSECDLVPHPDGSQQASEQVGQMVGEIPGTEGWQLRISERGVSGIMVTALLKLENTYALLRDGLPCTI